MQQYYVAVGCAQSKLVTLLDLLRAVVAEGAQESQEHKDNRIGICCSSRDSCDEVVLGAAKAGFQVACWHADMSADELATCGRLFVDHNLPPSILLDVAPNESFVHPDEIRRSLLASDCAEPKCAHLLVATDAAVRAVPQHGPPLDADLLINYDLPATREQHLRRISCIISGKMSTERKRAIIHFVVAGQITSFRALEQFAACQISEMPVHAADVLLC